MYKKRRENLSKNTEKNSITILFSGVPVRRSEDNFYKLDADRNFFYLTGINRDNCIYFKTNFENKKEEILFIKKPNEKMEKWVGKYLKEDEAKEISTIPEIKFQENFIDYLETTLRNEKTEYLYLDINPWDFKQSLSESQKLGKIIREKYPHIIIKNINYNLEEMRLIKNKDEIQKLKKAIDITNKAIKNMLKNTKPNLYEYEIVAHYDFILGLNGVTNSFNTIAASGKNGVILHYEENNTKTEDGDLILCDLGVKYKEYNSDITRTFPVNGKFTQRQKEVYKIVLDTNKRIIQEAKPGITLNKLNEIAKETLIKGCQDLGLIKSEDEISKYYYHSVSHFLGLDVHDVGNKNIKLKEGMVITVEPGLYIEEEEIGIRIEDDILITDKESINLSKDIPKEIEELEKILKN